MTKDKASQASQEEVDPRDTHRGQKMAMQKERQQTELQRAQEMGQSPRTRAGQSWSLRLWQHRAAGRERLWSRQESVTVRSWGSNLPGPGAQSPSPDQEAQPSQATQGQCQAAN